MISSLKSKFDTGDRRAILLSSTKLFVYLWIDGKLGRTYMFDVTDQGRAFFDNYIKESELLETYFVVDIVEEEYRQETIPHVFGGDRRAVIKRKKERLFRDTPYFHAEIQGRVEEGRRDDRVLFTALTNQEIIQPWIDILLQNKVPLAGIYSIPQITSLLLDKLPEPSDHMLIVSMHSITGLRQTFFHKKELKISRLVDLPRYGTSPYAPIIREEVDVITRYLNSLRLIDSEKPYEVYFLADNKLLSEIKSELDESASVNYHFVNLNTFSRECGLEIETANPFSEKLFIYHLLKERPGNYYAQKNETHYYRMSRIRGAMYVTSVCMVLASLIWGSINFTIGLSYRKQAELSQKQYQYYSERLKEARKELAPSPVSPYDLKTLVEMADTLKKYKTDPADIFQVISRGLARFPQIELTNITWNSSSKPASQENTVATGDLGRGLAGYSTLEVNSSDYKYFQNIYLDGYLASFDGNYRKGIATINNFVESLRGIDAVEDVAVIKLPLNTGSDNPLSGDTNNESLEANFSVRLVMGVIPNG